MFDAFFVGGLLAHLCGSAHSMSTPLHEFGIWPFLLRCWKDYTCTLRSLESVAIWLKAVSVQNLGNLQGQAVLEALVSNCLTKDRPSDNQRVNSVAGA